MQEVKTYENYYRMNYNSNIDMRVESIRTRNLCTDVNDTKRGIQYSHCIDIETMLSKTFNIASFRCIVIPINDCTEEHDLQKKYHIDAVAHIIIDNIKYLLPIDFKFREKNSKNVARLATFFKIGEYNRQYGILEDIHVRYTDPSACNYIIRTGKEMACPFIFDTNITDIKLLPHMTLVLSIDKNNTYKIDPDYYRLYDSELLYKYATHNRLVETVLNSGIIVTNRWRYVNDKASVIKDGDRTNIMIRDTDAMQEATKYQLSKYII